MESSHTAVDRSRGESLIEPDRPALGPAEGRLRRSIRRPEKLPLLRAQQPMAQGWTPLNSGRLDIPQRQDLPPGSFPTGAPDVNGINPVPLVPGTHQGRTGDSGPVNNQFIEVGSITLHGFKCQRGLGKEQRTKRQESCASHASERFQRWTPDNDPGVEGLQSFQAARQPAINPFRGRSEDKVVAQVGHEGKQRRWGRPDASRIWARSVHRPASISPGSPRMNARLVRPKDRPWPCAANS